MTRSLRLCLCLAAVGLAALLPSTSSASGWLRRGCGGCESAPCAPAAAPAPVQYETRMVTRYKPVMKERIVEDVVSRMVPRDEKYTYTCMVPVHSQEKRTVTCYEMVRREVDQKITVMVPTTVKEKRKVIECDRITKQVEYKYYEMVPRQVKEKVKQTVYDRRVKEVEETVPVCRVVRHQHVDECGRCYTTCERVTEMQKVKHCVVECVPTVREVEVCRTVCDRVERVGKRTVCEYIPREREIEVCAIRCEAQERIVKRCIVEAVPQKREVLVNVCHYKAEKRDGVRRVYDCVRENVKRKVQYCEMVPYQEEIRVPVCPTSACNDSCGDHGRRRLFAGLFNRGGCCD